MATCTQCGAELKPGTILRELRCKSIRTAACRTARSTARSCAPAPGSADPGCTAAPTACTDAPAAAGKRRQSLCRQRTCRPAAPDERSESLRRQCARHTAADRRRRTALRRENAPVRTACHAAATRRHGRQPLRQCGPRRQAQAPPRTNVPQADDLDRHPGDIPAYDHRNND